MASHRRKQEQSQEQSEPQRESVAASGSDWMVANENTPPVRDDDQLP